MHSDTLPIQSITDSFQNLNLQSSRDVMSQLDILSKWCDQVASKYYLAYNPENEHRLELKGRFKKINIFEMKIYEFYDVIMT